MSEVTNHERRDDAAADADRSLAGEGTRPIGLGKVRPRTMGLLAVAVVFGLLLWAKLLLVTGHPRTALADPDEQQEAGQASEPASPRSPAPGRASR